MICDLLVTNATLPDARTGQDGRIAAVKSGIAAEVWRLGLGSRAVASHRTSMHSMGNDYASKLIPPIAEAAPNVVANPSINITLQGRYDIHPRRRGPTRIPELAAARAIKVDGYGVSPGAHADFVLLQAMDTIEAIRMRATRLASPTSHSRAARRRSMQRIMRRSQPPECCGRLGSIMSRQAGRHCLQSTDRINGALSAAGVITRPTIDRRSAGFGVPGRTGLVTMRTILERHDRVVIDANTAISAWTAAPATTLAPSGVAVRT